MTSIAGGIEMATCHKWHRSNTFVVQIIRSERGTWQGQVTHTQTGEAWRFNSCLEMIRFMDRIVTERESKNPPAAPNKEEKGAIER